MPAGGLGIGTALTLGSQAAGMIKNTIDAFSAAKQLKKDKAELASLKPAFYKIQDEYFQNKNSAAENAQGGFTQDSKDLYTDQMSRGVGTGISATLQAGGSPNDIARIFQGYNDGVRSFAAADSEKKLDNIKYFHQVNKDLAGQKNIQWGVNEYQPYQSKLKELTQRINADKINKNNAINSAIGGIGDAGTALSNQRLLDQLFGDNSGKVADLPGIGMPAADGGMSGLTPSELLKLKSLIQ